MDDELTSKQLDLLKGIESELPPELEDRLVQQLREEGLVRSRSRFAPIRSKRLRHIAAAVLFFAVGALSQSLLSQRADPVTVDERDRYALLLYRSPDVVLSAEERASRIEEYSAWARALAADGKLEMGERLDDTAVSFRGSEVGLSAGEGERVNGLFVVRSATPDEAERIARSCPHVLHGERVELRRIDSGDSRN